MTAIRVRWPDFIRRNALPLWFVVWAPVGWLLGAPPVVPTIYAALVALCWMCEREVKYLDVEIAALKAEAAERELRDLYVEGFSTPMRVPAEMSDQEVATILWLLSRGIEEAS